MLRETLGNGDGTKLKVSESSGFEAMYGGRYRTNVTPNRFQFIGSTAYFWTSTEDPMNIDEAKAKDLGRNNDFLGEEIFFKSDALSLRFIQIK